MELAQQKGNPPPGSRRPEGLPHPIRISQQCEGIEEAQDSSHNQLRMLPAQNIDYRPRHASEDDGAKESAGDSTRKFEMIKGSLQTGTFGRAVEEDIMCCLQVEGFFHFGIRC
jgi:hypothetical protein